MYVGRRVHCMEKGGGGGNTGLSVGGGRAQDLYVIG